MGPYAGPQSYPQVREQARYDANKPIQSERGGSSLRIEDAREQMERCWLCCDDCRKWRLVDRNSFPAVDPRSYAKRAGGEQFDWTAWMAGSRGRYDAFLLLHAQQAAQTNPDDDIDVPVDGGKESRPGDDSCAPGDGVDDGPCMGAGEFETRCRS